MTARRWQPKWPMGAALRHIESGDIGVLKGARRPVRLGCSTTYSVRFTDAEGHAFVRNCIEQELTDATEAMPALRLVVDNTALLDTAPSEMDG